MISKAQKKQVVENVKNDLKEYPTIAVANLEGLSSDMFSKIKKKVFPSIKMDMARNNLLLMAMESKPELKPLESFVNGPSAILLSSLNGFKLFKLLKQNKSKAFAKLGQQAPFDLVVPAGETNFPPGPMLTELKTAKIEAKIQGPKIVITKDCIVAKKGEVISAKVAGILSKLDIKPMEVGFNVVAVYDNGVIYPQSVLDLDDSYYISLMQVASGQALNLSVNASIFNKDSVCVLIGKGGAEAKALSAGLKHASS